MQPPNLCVITELMKGSLADLLYKDKVKLRQDQVIRIAIDIAKGMRHLHSLNPVIIHRDLKSNNILVCISFVDFLTRRWTTTSLQKLQTLAFQK